MEKHGEETVKTIIRTPRKLRIAWVFFVFSTWLVFSASFFYHSAVNFATLGYGDIVMSGNHKLLGPIEAINGVLMIGVSTAVLMTVFQDALKKTIKARQRQGSNT